MQARQAHLEGKTASGVYVAELGQDFDNLEDAGRFIRRLLPPRKSWTYNVMEWAADRDGYWYVWRQVDFRA